VTVALPTRGELGSKAGGVRGRGASPSPGKLSDLSVFSVNDEGAQLVL